MTEIIIPIIDEFNKRFPDLAALNLTQGDLDNAQPRAKSYISNVVGEILLEKDLQTQGVYLATAHVLFLLKNPDKTGGRLTSATEGSVSAGFQSVPVNSIRDWALSRTEYGLELLQILQLIQPPLPEKSSDPYPYYTTGGWRV